MEQTGSYGNPVIDMTLEVHKTTAGSPYGGTIRINKQRKTKYARSGNTFFCGIPIILINSQKYIIFIPLNIRALHTWVFYEYEPAAVIALLLSVVETRMSGRSEK
jgi:hypothetical protein